MKILILPSGFALYCIILACSFSYFAKRWLSLADIFVSRSRFVTCAGSVPAFLHPPKRCQAHAATLFEEALLCVCLGRVGEFYVGQKASSGS
jgi:hypothetical protein